MTEPKKYLKYVREIKLAKDVCKEYPERRKPGALPMLPMPLLIDGRTWPQATKHFEVFLIKEPCGTNIEGRDIDPTKPSMVFEPDLFAGDDGETLESLKDLGNLDNLTHYHRHEEWYIFLGTNPDDPEDLGGELEMWLGIGNNAEKFIITKSTTILVPPGLAAHPMVFRRVDRPILKIVIYDYPMYSLIPVGINPPEFKP